MMFVCSFSFAAVTQAIGAPRPRCAFIAAILIGGLKHVDRDAVHSVRHVGMAFFVPFFAYISGRRTSPRSAPRRGSSRSSRSSWRAWAR